jgi:hypothetical protein
MITFAIAITQRTAMNELLQYVNQQMPIGKRESGGVILYHANISIAAKFDS